MMQMQIDHPRRLGTISYFLNLTPIFDLHGPGCLAWCHVSDNKSIGHAVCQTCLYASEQNNTVTLRASLNKYHLMQHWSSVLFYHATGRVIKLQNQINSSLVFSLTQASSVKKMVSRECEVTHMALLSFAYS